MAKKFEHILSKLNKKNYIADDETAMSIYLAQNLKKPLLIEGPSGVGKTEIAKVISLILSLIHI